MLASVTIRNYGLIMSKLRILAISASLALVTACAPTMGPPPPPPGTGAPSATVFRQEDFSWSAVPGRNTIDGRLTYRQGTTRYTCSGAGVVLTPETPWTRRRMTILYSSPEAAALPADEVRARTPSAPNDDYSSFVRRTTCDAADRFTFANLPDGAWFVITVTRPSAGAGPSIAIMRRVVTRGGRISPIDL